MKTTLLSLIVALVIPTVSSAKVDGFNDMINESHQAQQQLRQDLKGQMGVAQTAQMAAPHKEAIEIADGFDSNVNTPTKKSLLTFQKETVQYRPSDKKQQQRLANELKSMNAQF